MTKAKPSTNTSRGMSKAYAPPEKERRGDDIAESVCRILDDSEPRPMVGLRPAKKVQNAAEQFDAEHQQPYEAHAARSRDVVDTVRAHNTAYPKMHDELRKRRSVGKITMNAAQRNSNYVCKACSKKLLEAKKKPTRQLPRVQKRRIMPRRSLTKKPRQHRVVKQRFSKLTSKRTLTSERKMAVEKGTLTSQELVTLANCKNENSSDQSEDRTSLKNPDTDASMSSYNSYASLDHEPMVEN